MTADAFVIGQMGGGNPCIAAFIVDGIPEPKGSVSAFVDKRTGRARVKFGSTSKRKDGTRSDGPRRYAAWCRSVTAAGVAWQLVHRRVPRDSEALEVEILFRLPRLASTSKHEMLPIRKPDIDKLARCVLDCLTKAEVIADDARIVDLFVRKRFAFDARPRAEIFIRDATGQQELC